MAKKITREVKVGLLVIISGAILYFGFNFLKGINIFKSTNSYYATYDNIGGLVETAPVYIKGYKVGQISKITYDFTSEQPFMVCFEISRDLKLPQGTQAELFDDGLMGGKAINVIYAPHSGVFQEKGDTLQSTVSIDFMTKLSESLFPQIEKILATTDSLITYVNLIAGSPHIERSLASIESTTANLENTSLQLKGIMNKDIPSIVENVDVITNDFATVGSNLKNIDFNKTFQTVDQTVEGLQSVTQKINSSEGSLGLLLNDPMLYNNFNSAAKSADSLLIDLKENPKNYVHFSIFGKKK